VPDWLILALCGIVVVAVFVKAFWNPPRPDPDKRHGPEEQLGAGSA